MFSPSRQTALLCLLLGCSSLIIADDSEGTAVLEEIIVSGFQPLATDRLPSSTSLINRDDVEAAHTFGLAELLAQQANLTLNSFSATDKTATLDVRGSGATSVSNVLVLVDGIPINAPDLSGADYSALSPSQVERIEVLRGGQSVRYGSGASQGVINIISRRPDNAADHNINSTALGNSFGSHRITAGLYGSSPVQSMSLKLDAANQRGYRDNDRLKGGNASLRHTFDAGNHLTATTSLRWHEDDYQLPGPLPRLALANGSIDRDESIATTAITGKTHVSAVNQALRFQYSDSSASELRLGYRDRENLFALGRDLATLDNAERDRIQIRQRDAELIHSWDSPEHRSHWSFGLAHRRSDYSRSAGGQFTLNTELNAGNLETNAAYIHTRLLLNHWLEFTAGYRREKTQHRFGKLSIVEDENSPLCTSTVIPTGLPPPFDTVVTLSNCPLTRKLAQQERHQWRNEAMKTGLIVSLANGWNGYISAARTFRVPNVDELALAPIDLGPQRADRYEIGLRRRHTTLETDITLFHSRTRDEILFLPTGAMSGTNRNYLRPIERSGGELTLDWRPGEIFSLRGNVGYTDARARTENGEGPEFHWPLAPFMTAGLRLQLRLPGNIDLNTFTRYTDERPDGNDFGSGEFERIHSYSTTRAGIHKRWSTSSGQEISLRLTVVNAFNENYNTIAYSNTVYPAPKRHWSASLNYEL